MRRFSLSNSSQVMAALSHIGSPAVFKSVDWLDRLNRWPRPRFYGLLVALMLVIAYLDYITGERFSVHLLYFPVISLACWIAGRRPAIILSFLASVLWILDDFLVPPTPLPDFFKYWDSLARFLVYSGFVYVFARLRTVTLR